MFRFVRSLHLGSFQRSTDIDPRAKTLDPITLFHSPSLASSTRALNILKQASAAAGETATEDQASDHSSHAKQQRGEFKLEVSTDVPTTDQLRNILDYVNPVSGVGGQGDKATYAISELVKGAKDAEQALKLFKEDPERFVRPVVCLFPLERLGVRDDDADLFHRLLIGSMDVRLSVTMSLRFCAWCASCLPTKGHFIPGPDVPPYTFVKRILQM